MILSCSFRASSTCASSVRIGSLVRTTRFTVLRLFLFIKRDGKFKLISYWIHQREEATLCVDETDHLLHNQAQYLVKLKCRIQHPCNIVQGLQLIAFSLERVNTRIQSLALSFKWGKDTLRNWLCRIGHLTLQQL